MQFYANAIDNKQKNGKLVFQEIILNVGQKHLIGLTTVDKKN